VTWPRIFHRVWLDEDESPRFAAWKERLAELHPDWEIKTWQDSSEFTWLRNQSLFDRYLRSDPFGRVPDILRYELLWRYGGVYIDCDFEPLRPFDDLLDDPRPFAAWENDRTMCTALLAAPPKHPAIDELIRGLPERAAAFEGAPPNHATGPEYATALWRVRDDVRRLPPWTFYPVGWWERDLLGNPKNYHPDTYAVHHWAKGWGDDAAERKALEALRVRIVVPWRSGDPVREDAWAFVRSHLEALNWPICEADADGTWNRSQAINRAAEGEWDVAVIVDADTLHDLADLRAAVAQAHADQSVVVPWDVRWKLSPDGSERIRAMEPAKWRFTPRLTDRADRTPPRLRVRDRGGTVVVPRKAWDAIGGFDEGFNQGWGHEDVAFRIAAETLAPGGLAERKGTIWHLWHERHGPVSEIHEERKRRYEEAAGDALALRQLRDLVSV
jgi:hypothetical protein